MPRRTLAAIAVTLATLSVAAGLADPIERFTPGQLYVAGGNPGVFAFDENGSSVPSGLTGLRPVTGLTPLTGLSSIHDLTFGPEGSLYVTDNDRDRVFVYQAAGLAPAAEFGAGTILENPTDLTFGPRGRLYVASSSQNVILAFRRDGSVVRTLGPNTDLLDPRGLVFANDNHVFVSSHGNDLVLELDGGGTQLNSFGPGSPLDGPYGLAFARDGHLLVASYGTHEVLRFTAAGVFVDSWSGGGLTNPTALAFGPDRNLYVASSGSDEIVIFDNAGVVVGTIGDDTALSGPTGLAFAPFLRSTNIKGVVTRPDGSHRRMSTRATLAWAPGSGTATLLVAPDDLLAELFGTDVMTFSGRSTSWDKGGAFVGTEIADSARAASWGALGIEFGHKTGEDTIRKLSGSLNKGGPEGSLQARLKGRRH